MASYRRAKKPDPGEIVGIPYRQHPRYRGVVGHWLMNEGGGITVHDSSGFGSHGTLTNMEVGTDWRLGTFGRELIFGGTDEEIALGDSRVVNALNQNLTQMTLSFWTRSIGTGELMVWRCVEDGGSNGIACHIDSRATAEKLLMNTAGSEAVKFDLGGSFDFTIVHHWVLVFDSVNLPNSLNNDPSLFDYS